MTHHATIAPDQDVATLLDQGYLILEDAAPAGLIAQLDDDLAPAFTETPFGTGSFYGETTKRFGRLLARSPAAAPLIQHERILGIVETVLGPWCDTVQLNVAQAIAVHPGAPSQMPHRDQDMWRATPGAAEYLINVIWPLTDFRADNGATIVWPHTHAENVHQLEPDGPGVPAAMKPGSALIFLGSTLHGAGANHSQDVRRGIVVGYSLGWLKPYENQHLAYPPDVARCFSPDLAALVGYRQHRPNLGNYEGQCPSVLLTGGATGPLGAIDALRPDQREAVDAYLDRQRQSA